MPSSTPAPLLVRDQVVGNVWIVGDRIGAGTYSDVYRGIHVSTGAHCALKVDKPVHRTETLQWESDLLLKLQKYPFVPRHYGLHTTPGKVKVLAMQLLGNNISHLRSKQPAEQLPYGAVLHIVLQMLAAVEAIHQEGYIHRDLKPSNFVVGLGPAGCKQLYMLDFGQSRMYLDDKGGVRPARPVAEFRGTSLYSSLNSHDSMDLGRRDDLWSLFYVMADLLRGGLPWRPYKTNRAACHALKLFYQTHPEELVGELPGAAQLLEIHKHLKTLSFEAAPNYSLIGSCLRTALAESERIDATALRYRGLFPSAAGVLEKAGITVVPEASGATSPDAAGGSATAPTRAVSDVDTAYLLQLFDLRDVPMSCDCVLESRGGRALDWDVDTSAVPVYVALRVDGAGQPAPEALRLMHHLLDERDACVKLLEDAIDMVDGDDEEAEEANASDSAEDEDTPSAARSNSAPTEAGHAVSEPTAPARPASEGQVFVEGTSTTSAVATSAPLASADVATLPASSAADSSAVHTSGFVAGRKRRRDEVAVVYTGKSSGFALRSLEQRVSELAASFVQRVVAATAAAAAIAAVEPSHAVKSESTPSVHDGSASTPTAASVLASGTADAHASSAAAVATTASTPDALSAKPSESDVAVAHAEAVSYALAWRDIANTVCECFGNIRHRDTVRPEIVLFVRRVLAAATLTDEHATQLLNALPALPLPVRVLRESHKLLALRYPSMVEQSSVAMQVARLELWLSACSGKPAPAVSLMTIGSASVDGTAPLSEKDAQHERKLRRSARRRLLMLNRLLRALERERDLQRPPTSHVSTTATTRSSSHTGAASSGASSARSASAAPAAASLSSLHLLQHVTAASAIPVTFPAPAPAPLPPMAAPPAPPLPLAPPLPPTDDDAIAMEIE